MSNTVCNKFLIRVVIFFHFRLEHKNSFIIVAAHSNVAVDLLVKDLIKYIPKGQIKRLASEARMRHIPDEIREYATSNADVITILRDLRVLCGTLGILGKAKLFMVST